MDIYQENYEKQMDELMKHIQEDTYIEKHEKGLVLPIYWAVDNKMNINFDVESMRDEFEKMIERLERHNDESDFDWDNC
jgi:exonuclease VII small subunit